MFFSGFAVLCLVKPLKTEPVYKGILTQAKNIRSPTKRLPYNYMSKTEIFPVLVHCVFTGFAVFCLVKPLKTESVYNGTLT